MQFLRKLLEQSWENYGPIICENTWRIFFGKFLRKTPSDIYNGNPGEIPAVFTVKMSGEMTEYISEQISGIIPWEFPGRFSKINPKKFLKISLYTFS